MAQEIQKAISGKVLTPEDNDAYDAAIKTFNAIGTDFRPKFVIQCATPDDVVYAVKYAKEHNLSFSVKCGGHSPSVRCLCDGVVADLSPMRQVVYDAATETVEVGGGCLLAQPNEELDKHQRGFVTGTVPITGVSGLSLGGGYSFMSRRHGLAIDNFVSLDVILADGTQVKASKDENPDLFWALKGGRGSYGIVTKFVFKAHPVHRVYGGLRMYSVPTDAVLTGLIEAFGSTLPKLQPYRDKTILMGVFRPGPVRVVFLAYCDITGDADVSLLSDFEPFQENLNPESGYGDITWLQMQNAILKLMTPPPGVAPPPPARQYWAGGSTADGAPADFKSYFSHFADQIAKFDWDRFPMTLLLLEQWGGAINDPKNGDTLFARGSEFSYGLMVGSFAKEDDQARQDYAQATARVLNSHPMGRRVMYINYLAETEVPSELAADMFGGSEVVKRAASVKHQYDPENFFGRVSVPAAP